LRSPKAALQAALLAAVRRSCAMFLIAAQVTASTLRENSGQGLELMMSLPLSRTTQYSRALPASHAVPYLR
jgi:hypothetical protein